MDKENSVILHNPNDEKKEFKEIGFLIKEEYKVYITNRNFYSHKYNLLDSYFFEEELINLLIEKGVTFIVINEIHNNETSNIHEKKMFVFPINLLKKVNLQRINHETSGFDKQIGIPREMLLHFEI